MNPEPALQPGDDHHPALMAQVHPADWVNPQLAAYDDQVVIGTGKRA